MFTARNRQNPFAKRRREAREARESEKETAAVMADPDAMAAIAEADAEPTAVPHDTRNDASDGITDVPYLSTFATGGLVFPPTEEQQAAADELLQVEQEVDPTPVVEPIPVELAPVISAETRAKVDAVLNHAITPVADSAPVEPEPTPEPAAVPAESEPKRGRGRPRPQETIDRDNAVHELLKAADAVEGVSKEALAISLDEKEQQVYSSLRQLSKEGRAETRYVKGHGYRWFAVTEG